MRSRDDDGPQAIALMAAILVLLLLLAGGGATWWLHRRATMTALEARMAAQQAELARKELALRAHLEQLGEWPVPAADASRPTPIAPDPIASDPAASAPAESALVGATSRAGGR